MDSSVPADSALSAPGALSIPGRGEIPESILGSQKHHKICTLVDPSRGAAVVTRRLGARRVGAHRRTSGGTGAGTGVLSEGVGGGSRTPGLG